MKTKVEATVKVLVISTVLCSDNFRYYGFINVFFAVLGRWIFERFDAPLRTDESFRQKLDAEYHQNDSPFEDLDIDMVRTFALDYMHLVLVFLCVLVLLFFMK